METTLGRLLIIFLLACPMSFSAVFASFVDWTPNAGLSAPVRKSFGNATWVDINNDGLLDVVNS